MGIGYMLKRVGYGLCGMDALVFYPIEQLFNAVREQCRLVEKEAQVEGEYASVLRGHAQGIEAWCAPITPQQSGPTGPAPFLW